MTDIRSLTNKRILLGVSGGIAAYKSAELIRRLQDAGAEVRVVMTKAAQEFITPLTLQALSGFPVHTSLLDPEAEAGMGHIQLARWADVILIAPASADVMARLAQGMGDDLLTTVCLASSAKLAIAPAMNQGMWGNASTQANLELLKNRGALILGPASGGQACGDVGMGRLLEPAEIIQGLATLFTTGALAGLKVVITAGPTREAIDPVRYISNHSSGKMGYALAQAAMEAGAGVVLISGPVNIPAPERVERVAVTSADEMLAASLAHSDCDIFIAAAAVADYKPAIQATQKIKKTGEDELTLRLIKNPDIVATIASQRRAPNKPLVIGFAAETENLLEHAQQKLEKKQLNWVIANNVASEGIGFNSDENAVTIVSPQGHETLTQRSKQQLARDLIVKLAADFQPFL